LLNYPVKRLCSLAAHF